MLCCWQQEEPAKSVHCGEPIFSPGGEAAGGAAFPRRSRRRIAGSRSELSSNRIVQSLTAVRSETSNHQFVSYSRTRRLACLQKLDNILGREYCVDQSIKAEFSGVSLPRSPAKSSPREAGY